MRYIVPVRDEMKCSAKVLRLRKKKNTVCDRIVTIGLYAFSYIYIFIRYGHVAYVRSYIT